MKLVNHLDSDGVTILTAKTVPQVKAGTIGTPKKLALQNVGDEVLAGLEHRITQVGSGDGYTMAEWGFDAVTLSPPWGLSAVVLTNAGSTQWGSGGAGRKFFVITALLGGGETGPSMEVFADIVNVGASLGDRVSLNWQTVPGATQYKIYRSVSSGAYATPALRATVNAPGTSYTEDGASLSSGAPPVENTTGGAGPTYGSPPGAFQTTPLVIGSLPVGKAIFYWLQEDVPLGTSSTGNPRTVSLEPVET